MIKYAPAPLPAAGRPPATADAINARRRMAESLVNEGTSYAPVQHVTQGIARVAQAALGQHELNQTAAQSRDLAEFDENQATRKRMAERLAAMDDKKHMTEWERSLPPTALQQAQINKYNRQATEAGHAYGKNGTTVMGPDGNYYTVRYGADGTERINPLQLPGSQHMGGQQPEQTPVNDGAGRFAAPGIGSVTQPPVQLTPSRGVGVTGDLMYNKETGAPVRDVGANLRQAEAQKAMGDAAGKAAASAPSDIMGAEIALQIVDSLRNDPNRQLGTGVSSIFNIIPSTPGYDFSTKVEQAKSGAFLTAIQQLRGMGALSNAEGQTATKAVTRMSTATSEGEFLAALEDYEQIVKRGHAAANGRLQNPTSINPPPPAAARVRTYNPQTGRLE